MDRRKAIAAIGVTSLAGALLSGCGRADAPQQAGVSNDKAAPDDASAGDGNVDYLFVQESKRVKSNGTSVIMVDVNPKTLFFSDRPEEIAGYLSFPKFLEMVTTGPDNFNEDPPNATLVFLGDENMAEVVMELVDRPTMIDGDLVFPIVNVIQGTLPQEGGPAALFIDVIGRPMTPMSVAGVHRRTRRRR